MKVNRKTGKDRLDKYYHLAKEHGYRSRSAFKIIQLAKKFNFFENCNVVVDLCAAPGGWLQVASKQLPVSSTIIGVDLVQIKPIKGVLTFQADIRTAKCRSMIMNHLKGAEVDLVLHDGAPNMGCNWNMDAFNQNVLVLDAAKLASSILKKGGIFVTKIFRSADYNSLIWMLSNCFDKVKVTKPQSSRNVSAEIFAVCIGFKSLKGLDPRLFNCDYVFLSERQTHAEDNAKKSLNQLIKEKSKARKEGYEAGDFCEHTILEFLRSDNPANLLVSASRLVFRSKDSEDSDILDIIQNDPITTDEIKLLCSDIQVAGKADLQSILKWRTKILKHLPNFMPEKAVDKPDMNNIELDEESLIELEKQKLSDIVETNRKRAERKQRKLLKKRKSVGKSAAIVGVDPELFQFSSLSGNRPEDIPYSESSSSVEEIELEESELSSDDEANKILKMDIDLEVQHSLNKANEEDKQKKHSNLTRRQKVNMEKSLELTNFIDHMQYQARIDASEAKQDSDDEPDRSELISERWFDQDIFNEDIETVNVSKRRKSDPKDDFVIVPAISNAEIEASKRDEFDDLSKDSQTVEQIQALGSLMINKKTRMSLIDGTYNKRTFDDGELPSWFIEDENKHNKQELPISKDLMKKYKAKLLEIKNRPIRKVLEAKARKKMRADKKIKGILPRIESMSNDITKAGNARKLIKKVKNISSDKREKVYVVSRGIGRTKTSKPSKSGSRKIYKVVDKRLKKDKRNSKEAAKGRSKRKSRKARLH
ncbi:hypothetical protein BEWA_010890 [Theileria equi strain WA]|uniref:Putative rRNA methyltransferase n=1 Tax=Theileria equi strain WA TaxID=1537102 RepID=L0B1C5_THEEQ|nr:hypothetical protein BEWA_010890 [Theileria equi strain WA]AFZ81672.1 hypothetical protein BEWA_010890 [Theileria equi strain WA]|eukprot:XP_004831338.1 hypothetical protein BEWA_010890 [Theileria equi strain WA]